uniref:Uncharacterized protein n=1 Tax=Strigamia maritima TaxID=126957 RepID=T1J155_STRMM
MLKHPTGQLGDLGSSPGLGSNGVWAVCFSPSTVVMRTLKPFIYNFINTLSNNSCTKLKSYREVGRYELGKTEGALAPEILFKVGTILSKQASVWILFVISQLLCSQLLLKLTSKTSMLRLTMLRRQTDFYFCGKGRDPVTHKWLRCLQVIINKTLGPSLTLSVTEIHEFIGDLREQSGAHLRCTFDEDSPESGSTLDRLNRIRYPISNNYNKNNTEHSKEINIVWLFLFINIRFTIVTNRFKRVCSGFFYQVTRTSKKMDKCRIFLMSTELFAGLILDEYIQNKTYCKDVVRAKALLSYWSYIWNTRNHNRKALCLTIIPADINRMYFLLDIFCDDTRE